MKSRISARWRSSAGTRSWKRRVGPAFGLIGGPFARAEYMSSSAGLRLHALPRFEHVAPRALAQRIQDQDLLPVLERLAIVPRGEGLHPLDVELLDPRIQLGFRCRKPSLDPVAPVARLGARRIERERALHGRVGVRVAPFGERAGDLVQGDERRELVPEALHFRGTLAEG